MNKVKLLYRKLSNMQWHIGFIINPIDDLMQGKDIQIQLMKHNVKNVWFADPFILDVTDDYIVVLAEEFLESEKKGRISRLLVDKKDFSLWDRKTILELETHLSYPAIFREEDNIYIYPENHDSGSLVLYRYDSKKESVLKDRVLCTQPLTDATMTTIFGKDIIFSTHIPIHNRNIIKWYKKEEKNGIYEEAGSYEFKENIARMGGDFFEYKGAIYRPAQECNESYGHAISIQKVEYLNDSFRFEEALRICSPLKRYKEGIHTLNIYKGIMVTDVLGFQYRWGEILYHLRHLFI